MRRASASTDALKAIGRIVADVTVTPKQRLAQITGVLRMNGYEPPPVVAAPVATEAAAPPLPLSDGPT